jgi:hypothetical protein
MDADFEKLLDEAIILELNVSDLYFLFYELFPEDSQFWWTLVIEEKNHASLIESAKALSPIWGSYPMEMINEKIEKLIEMNQKIISIITDFKKNPSRKSAFIIALELEQTCCESHLQTFIKNENLPKKLESLKNLYIADKDHAERIQKYMREHNI